MSKVMASAAEAVADIEDGASLGIAGFGVSHRYPSTLITALRDKGPARLTVYCNGLGQPGFPTAHLLADNHQIGHLVTCFSARPGVVSEAEKQIDAGEMTLEMVPQGTLVERMRAGGAGLPAFYTPTGYGTQIAEGKDIRYFDGRPYVLEKAITTDFALVRAQKADHMGNLVFRGGSRNFNVSFAKAARVTIVEAEEIVPTGGNRARGRRPARCLRDPGGAGDGPDGREKPADAGQPPGFQRALYFGKPALTREQIGRRVAALLPDGAVVNLGAGLPTQVANFTRGRVMLHSENGMLNYGEFVRGDDFDPDLHDAGGYFVSLRDGASFFDSVTSFEIARGGRLYAVVLGTYQVGRQRRPGELVGARHGGRRHRRRDGSRRRGTARDRDARAHRLAREPQAGRELRLPADGAGRGGRRRDRPGAAAAAAGRRAVRARRGRRRVHGRRGAVGYRDERRRRGPGGRDAGVLGLRRSHKHAVVF